MSQTFNPFEHHHEHESDAAPEAEHPGVPIDPAQQSLADALRVTFAVLKGVILVLLVLYACSGFFSVGSTEKAVRLRFGRMVGEGRGRVLEPGWYLGWPFPIDQVVRIDTRPQSVQLDRAFWFDVPPGMEGKTAEEMTSDRPLNPEKDGSLITGDANILHAQFTVNYVVDDLVLYLENVKEAARAQALVRAAAEDAVVFAVGQLSADAAFSGQLERTSAAASDRAQKALTAMGTGLKLSTLIVSKKVLFPSSVRAAFQEVSNAQSQRTRRLEEADARWKGVLGGTAGDAAQPLLTLLDEYEVASQAGDQARVKAIDDQLDRAFRELTVDTPQGPLPIIGEVAQRMAQGRAESVDVVEKVRGEAQVFSSLLAEYQKSPRIVLSRLWEQAREEVLGGDVETFYLANGQVYFDLNRDPRIRKAREEAALSNTNRPPPSPGAGNPGAGRSGPP